MSKPVSLVNPSVPGVVASLREQLARWEGGRPLQDTSAISSGCAALDALLPWGGLPRGALIECLEQDEGIGGAGFLALILARQVAVEGGVIVIFDPRRRFYPPAAALLGIDLAAVWVLQVPQARDQLWAVDQCLRCPAVAAVWAPVEHLDPRDFRRLQLAAESGGGLGFLVRCSAARKQPSWSDLQLLIEPQGWEAAEIRRGRRLRVELTRCRQARSGGTIELEIDEMTGAMHPVSYPHEAYRLPPTAQLAYATADRRSTRA
ncbi:MAG: ImuA family protein [Pirellulaceae bacterium]